MPRKEFESFTRLDASDVNTYLMDQSVMTFADTAARDTAITSPVAGMLTYLEDSKEYHSYTGSAWIPVLSTGAARAFTPIWTNLTVGNGTYDRSHYTIAGKTVTVSIFFVLGSTSAITGNLGLDMPAELSFAGTKPGVSDLLLADVSALTRFVGNARFTGSTNFSLRNHFVSGSFIGTAQTINATNPFTWTTGDSIQFGAVYEVA
jgi:hypothetical protein